MRHLVVVALLSLVSLTTSTESLAFGVTPVRLRAACELVEIYPGYPGYQGYVTGVDGIGDVACLNDLQHQDPRFDRTKVDAANLHAAESLGIHGGPELWTWENWMAIEAEQDMLPTCYTCAFDLDNLRTPPTQTVVNPNTDPRLLVGFPFNNSDTEIRTNFAARVGVTLASAGQPLNAAELLQAIRNATYGGSDYFYEGDASTAWCTALRQGGYAPTPDTAAPSDQIFQLAAAFYVAYVPGLNPWAGDATIRLFEGTINAWQDQLASGSDGQSFAQFADEQMGDLYGTQC